MSPGAGSGAGSGEGDEAPDAPEARPPSLQRLDPDRAGGRPAGADPDAGDGAPEIGPREPYRPAPAIDTRPYRWAVGIIGFVIVVAVFGYQLLTHGTGTTGVPPGQKLHLFAAPLAASDLNGDPNAHPTCSPAHHDPRALNLCLMAAREPLVVAFYVNRASQCERQVSALQQLSARFPRVGFAAVAVAAGHAPTAAAVRAHRWTIPVAYDRDGAVQALYGVVACPMVELAGRGGVVRFRLIGNRWESVAALAPYVGRL